MNGRRFGGRGRGGFRGGFRGRGFGGPREDIPKPIKVGEEYDVKIDEVGSKGDGIARIKNFVVFVSGAKQGESIRIKITDVRNRFAIGEKIGEAKSESGEAEVEKVEEVEEEISEEETPKEEIEEVEAEESEE